MVMSGVFGRADAPQNYILPLIVLKIRYESPLPLFNLHSMTVSTCELPRNSRVASGSLEATRRLDRCLNKWTSLLPMAIESRVLCVSLEFRPI